MKIQTYYSGIASKVFVGRLMNYLNKHYGVERVKSKPDIYFSSVWPGSPPKRAVRVHRVNGVYFDKSKAGARSMNKTIAKAISKARGVVYQSNYSRNMSKGILGVKKSGRIIYNGFDKSCYNGLKADKFGFSKMLVACAKWRPLKRPRSIVKGFLAAGLSDAVLVMIGGIKESQQIKHPQVKYIGSIPPADTYKYYLNCDGVIHISRLDACPNVVIEALTAGKPVLGNNVGGTPELIKDSGVIIEIDPPLKYKMFTMKNPDKVSSAKVAAGIHQMLNTTWNIDRQDLSMKHCAKQYYDYFSELLC
ncbi:hypothetical protein LCGC14_0891870 [marine sediment metagenome]|uniref:Glycosyl transferase family 1 domain-containing protein n=1 Tax=marine sediment metagenome TaxID=412755 RepID=A0A0F9NYZ9_9ZZZZ